MYVLYAADKLNVNVSLGTILRGDFKTKSLSTCTKYDVLVLTSFVSSWNTMLTNYVRYGYALRCSYASVKCKMT